MRNSVSRRGLLGRLSIAVALLASRYSWGAEPTKLDIKDPAAVALGYVEDAAQVNAGKYATYVVGNNCENCLLLTGKSGELYRPCTLFPGKRVAIKGWCSGWTAEM